MWLYVNVAYRLKDNAKMTDAVFVVETVWVGYSVLAGPCYSEFSSCFDWKLKTQISEIVPSSGRNKSFLLNSLLNVPDHSQEYICLCYFSVIVKLIIII